jgi:hypothetical protein
VRDRAISAIDKHGTIGTGIVVDTDVPKQPKAVCQYTAASMASMQATGQAG